MTGTAAARADLAALAAEIARSTGVTPRLEESLARYTTMRVGGPADLLATARDAFQLAALVRFAREAGVPHAVIGRGSNLVVSDAGFRGLVILSRAQGCRVDGDRVIAEAGVPLPRAATLAERAGLSGLEFGLAIPGTVGGAIWANAGAHGSDVAAVLESARILRADGTQADEPAAALGLAYRESRFKRPEGHGSAGSDAAHAAAAGAISDAAGSSAAGSSAAGSSAAGSSAAGSSAAGSSAPDRSDAAHAAAAHAAAAHAAADRSAAHAAGNSADAHSAAAPAVAEIVLEVTFHLAPADPASIKARVDDIRRWRREHQPLNMPSAGSIFRNPPGDSAGRLIDAAGLKGARAGGAVISDKHANFIVNDRQATAADVRRLAELANAEVARRFGVELVYEVQFLGDWSDWRQQER